MKNYLIGAALVGALALALFLAQSGGGSYGSLRELRASLGATTIRLDTDRSAPSTPPAGVLELVRYTAPLGENLAYVSPIQNSPGPAVLYVAGGFDWGIGASAWMPAPWDGDQSGRAFQREGITVMYPSLRGSHSNPGNNECMLGEVDDLLAAAEYLAARPDVNPERIYLVGHSTGATLAVLVAELSTRFRAVFAIGPVTAAVDYGDICVGSNAENLARSPLDFIQEVSTPLILIEGEFDSNADAVDLYRDIAPQNVTAIIVPTLDHFSVLAPANELIADFIEADSPPSQFGSMSGRILSLARRGPPNL